MLRVSGAKGKAGIDRSGRDQGVSQLNAVRERMLFDEGAGESADGLGKRQNSELELEEGLADLPHLHLRSGALEKLHE